MTLEELTKWSEDSIRNHTVEEFILGRTEDVRYISRRDDLCGGQGYDTMLRDFNININHH